MEPIVHLRGKQRETRVIYDVIDVVSGKPKPAYNISAYNKVMRDEAHCGQQEFARRVIRLKPKF